MNFGEELSVRQALGEIGRVDREVRRSARWSSRFFLVFGVATAVYWAIEHFADDGVTRLAAVGWLLFTAWSIAYACRNRVYDRVFYRLQWVVTGLVLLSTVYNVSVNDYVRAGEGAWPVLAGVAGVILAAVPPLYGAWRGLTAPESRKGLVSDR